MLGLFYIVETLSELLSTNIYIAHESIPVRQSSVQRLSSYSVTMWAHILLLSTLVFLTRGQNGTGCDAACSSAFKQAYELESKSWVSPDISTEGFYSVPANASNAKPGDLLRWEDMTDDELSHNWTIPAGMSLSRFLYMSEDIDSKPIPASGFVVLPYSAVEPNATFRTVAWAHGTAGRIRQCAPSNHKALYYEWEGPLALAQAGYAVIATDYAGQGSDIPQGFMYESGYLHAADVAFGVLASRQAIGHLLSDDWVVIGHSEGGMTAWRTNERLAQTNSTTLRKAGTLIGAVSAAPALRPLDLIPESFRRAAGGPVGDVVSCTFSSR